MVAKDRQKSSASSKKGVGEIDTSPPFQSVKDAVSLFGEGSFSWEKPAIKRVKAPCTERVLAKETQLHLVHKELNKLKEQLKNAENTKAQALLEFDIAKGSVNDVMLELSAINEKKTLLINATEILKDQVKLLELANSGHQADNNGGWKQELETAVQQYMAVNLELGGAKQTLRKLHQDYDSCLEVTAASNRKVAEAEKTAKGNTTRADELSKEIEAVLESVGQVNRTTMQAIQEEAEIYVERDVLKQSYEATLEELSQKLVSLKKEIDPEHTKKLEDELATKMSEVNSLQTVIDQARQSDLDSMISITSELDGAKDSLHKVSEEENSLRRLLESLKLELEEVKKEHSELKEKETETESIVGNLHVKLRKSKAELDVAIAEEYKVVGACEEMVSTLRLLSSESENAKRVAEDTKKQEDELKIESENVRTALEEAEKRLIVVLEVVEEAKAAELRALDQIKTISERTSAARASTSESGANITVSRDEFESLSRKVEESERVAEMKVAAAMAQVEAVKASENEVLKKLEAMQKEIEDMKTATEAAIKQAEMSEAARKAVEGELRRWHECEQKKVADAASRILAETKFSVESSPSNHPALKQSTSKKPAEVRRLEKAKTSVSRKVLLPSLSIFQRKKNQVDGGSP